MIDIKLLRQDPDLFANNNQSRNVNISLPEILVLDQEWRTAQQKLDEQRAELKARSKQKPNAEATVALRELSTAIKAQEIALTDLEKKRDALLQQLPNLNDPEAPVGKSENDNQVIRTVGKKPKFSFAPRPYYELPSVTPHLLTTAGAHTSGARFYYLTGPLAELQRAVFAVVYEMILAAGFCPVVVPVLVRERAMYGTGHFPAEKFEVYSVNPDEDNLYLIGTSEVPLISLHDGATFTAEALPKKYCSLSTCFRREAGSYGKDQAGILRVHQFQKIEMISFVLPENSRAAHQEFLALEEKIVVAFGLHYQVLDICSADLGYPAARKFDVEAWFPSQKKFRELTSTSNTTDFQTRRLGINCVVAGERQNAHTINGTGATDRLWLAILEQYQRADGGVDLPPVLHPYLSFKNLAP